MPLQHQEAINDNKYSKEDGKDDFFLDEDLWHDDVETNQMLLPFEVLIEQRHHELFIKAWECFGYRLTYSEFARLITIMLGYLLSKEWVCTFLEHPVTKNLFEGFKVAD